MMPPTARDLATSLPRDVRLTQAEHQCAPRRHPFRLRAIPTNDQIDHAHPREWSGRDRHARQHAVGQVGITVDLHVGRVTVDAPAAEPDEGLPRHAEPYGRLAAGTVVEPRLLVV